MMPAKPLEVVVLSNDPALDFRISQIDDTVEATARTWSHDGTAIESRTLAADLADEHFGAICIGPDVPLELCLEVTRDLDRYRPEAGVVLLRESNAELWRDAARSGIRDIVEPDAIETDLVPALLAAAERSAEIRSVQSNPPEQAGRIIVVLSPKGGSGKTMLTTNLGMAIAASNNGQTVVVDLDCVFGDVASVMGLVPEHTIGELAMLPSFDSTTLKIHLSRHERSGLFVLAGSGLPEEGEAITDEVAGRVLRVLARDFPYVIVDTAAGLDERALAAIEVATDIVLLASMDVASVRNLSKEVDALNRLGFTGARRHFVLNRADTRVGLEVSDVEVAVGLPVETAIPSSRDVPLSMNQGRTLTFDEPKSPVAQELIGLANRFLGANATPIQVANSTRFSFRRR
jgi:pilus assembly protein CpaE